MSGPIWMQPVKHSDGIPEKLILKKISRQQKKHKNYPACNELDAKP